MEMQFYPEQVSNEEWYDKYPLVFRSKAEAIRMALPANIKSSGIEICLRKGKLAEALGITEGIEPSPELWQIASDRGIDVAYAEPEKLPYKRSKYDFALMADISRINDLHLSIKEVRRVLKPGGVLIIAFIDSNGNLGRFFEALKFYGYRKDQKFYSVERVLNEIKRAGFKNIKISQTIFHDPDDIKIPEAPKHGYGEGSYVIIRAAKR